MKTGLITGNGDMTGIVANIYGFLRSESDIPVPSTESGSDKKTHLNIVKLWVHGELNKPDNNSMVKVRNKNGPVLCKILKVTTDTVFTVTGHQ